MTIWLTGMLAIASTIMCIGLWPVVRSEMRSHDIPWWRNKALRVSGALYIHGAGAIVLFAMIPMYAHNTFVGLTAYLAWAVLGCWLIAKLLIISVTDRFKTAAVMFTGWSAGCALYALMEGGG